MTRPPDAPWSRDEQRNARIRRLREEREAPVRRRRTFQPLLLLAWLAGVAALVVILILIGFNSVFAPRLMAWVEDNPGAIEHGIVRDFVEWYRPGEIADEPASEDPDRITFEVPLGANDTSIGQMLFDAGLLRNQISFHYALIVTGREGTLEAGVYDLSPSMRPSEIIGALRRQAGPEVTVRIPEGARLEEVVAALGQSELTMNLEEFAALVQDPPADLLNQYAFFNDLRSERTLEGYLYPDTYRMDGNWTARQVLTRILDRFDQQVTAEMREQIAAQGITIDEAVTIASIVEREAVVEAERPLIAGVYLTRALNPQLETAGLLNADPTLQYGLATMENGGLPVDSWHEANWWPRIDVTGGDVQLPEELMGYQTYLVPGMPPTPIASPRISSIQAVAAPDTAEGYLYFVAGCPDGTRDGSHYFARSLPDHNANIARANEECAGQ